MTQSPAALGILPDCDVPTALDAASAPSPGPPESAEAVYSSVKWLITICVVAVVSGSMVRLPPIQNANDESRWSTVWSLVERGTYAIDDSPWSRTVDKIRLNGHFYSSKPPLFSTIVAGGYWILKTALGWRLETHPRHVVYTLLMLVNVIPLALMLLCYGKFLRRSGTGVFAYSFCMLAAGLGTYLTAYSVTLTNHTVGMTICFFVAFLVWSISSERLSDSRRSRRMKFALAGLAAGFLPSVDLLAAPFCVGVFFWLLWLEKPETLRIFAPAAAFPVIAFLVTNWLVVGDLRPAYAFKNSDLYLYPGSFWSNPRGIAANTDSNATYLFNVLIGHHGWFSHTPIFLIALAAMIIRPNRGPSGVPWFNAVVLVMFAAVTAFYVLNPSHDYGGTCHGFRWLFWMTPLWLMVMPQTVNSLSMYLVGRVALGGALAISVFSVAYALGGPWGTSWIHALFRYWGIVSY